MIETRNHTNTIKSEHEYLSNLAFLNKLDCRNNTIIDFKIPQAYLPNQILQHDANVISYIQDSIMQKEKVLLKVAKTFNDDTVAAAQKGQQQQSETSWLCSETPLKKRKTYRPTTPPLPPPPPPSLSLSSPQRKNKDKEELHIPLDAMVDIIKRIQSEQVSKAVKCLTKMMQKQHHVRV